MLIDVITQRTCPLDNGRAEGDLFILHPVLKTPLTDQLKMRFKKLHHGLILRERKSKTKKDRQMLNRTQIRYFRDVAGYEGLFLCGPYPHWILLSGRGE